MPKRDTYTFAQDLIEFIDNSPSSFHAVATISRRLSDAGFLMLDEREVWKLKRAGKYYIMRNESALVAFVVGHEKPAVSGFKLVGTHTDSPCFRLKFNPEIIAEDSYLKLNTEVYGGPILSSWMDRPLSLAGRVAICSDQPLWPKTVLVDFRRPLAIIPSLAIHMNRDVNDGQKLNKQIDMLPLLGQKPEKFEKKNFILSCLARELKLKPNEILDYDLFLYNPEKGAIIGLEREFISAPRLDNLASTYAAIEALTSSEVGMSTNVVVAFDNEEVGSSSKQGAASPLLSTILERIVYSLGGSRDDYFRAVSHSFMISADGAHAVHPNKGEKSDLTNRPLLNHGPVIKIAAAQTYTTDAPSAAVLENLCRAAKIPTQRFFNRSDERGGSTIGPISSHHLDVRSVDVGIPMLSMHSSREITGIRDPEYLMKALSEFFKA